MIFGTAGHVDHGKTALVRALTGVDTDRLPVEKARGITTELGFAPLVLDGQEHSLIDVPGHERFVAAMAAGAGGVDVALLVVAADEGVRPQTREHLDICALLGVRSAVLVLSKCDLADAERLKAVEVEVRRAARDTVFAEAPAVAVSSRTQIGFEALRRVLAQAVRDLSPRREDGVFFLPIDRAFTVKGFGTVVTGTVSSGALSAGEHVEVLPGARGEVRVRALHRNGREVARVAAGERAALNLVGVEVADLARGRVVARTGTVAVTERADVQLRSLSVSPRLRPREALTCLAGAARTTCRLLVLGKPVGLEPGESAAAQLQFEHPLPLLPGQRFLLRGFQPIEGHGRTLGGGQILQVEAPRRRAGASVAVEALAFADPARRLVALAGQGGATEADLFRRGGLGQAELRQGLANAASRGLLVHEAERWRPPAAEANAAPVAPALAPLNALEEAVLRELRRGELTPPTVAELGLRLRAEREGSAIARALDRLAAVGAAVRAGDGLFFDAQTVSALRQRLVDHLRHHGSITMAEFKSLTGSSRRFSIPLGELFDRERLTLRVGEKRVLREQRR